MCLPTTFLNERSPHHLGWQWDEGVQKNQAGLILSLTKTNACFWVSFSRCR